MTIAWIVVSSILGVIWLIAFVAITGIAIADRVDNGHEDDWDAYRLFAAVMAGLAFFVVFHWIILCAAVPLFVIYGSWQGLKILVKRPWKKEAEEELR